MARIWSGYSDVDVAVAAIKTMMTEVHVIPETLVRAYWINIERNSHGIVQHFYEKLARECPEGLKYFAEKPIEMDVV